MSINLGDLAKDCGDALRQAHTFVEELFEENMRQGRLLDRGEATSCEREPTPALFRYGGVNSVHTCVYCGQAKELGTLERFDFMPAYFAACCADCASAVSRPRTPLPPPPLV
jgi:hypothetical protein